MSISAPPTRINFTTSSIPNNNNLPVRSNLIKQPQPLNIYSQSIRGNLISQNQQINPTTLPLTTPILRNTIPVPNQSFQQSNNYPFFNNNVPGLNPINSNNTFARLNVPAPANNQNPQQSIPKPMTSGVFTIAKAVHKQGDTLAELNQYEQFYCTRNCWALSAILGILILFLAIFGTLEFDTINHKTKIKKLVNGTNNSTDKVNANITVDNNKTLAGTTSVAPLNNLPTSLIATPTGINVNPNIPTISTSAVTNTIPPITITPGINLQPIPIQNTPTAITNPNPIPNINPPSIITSLPPITAPTSLTIPTPPLISDRNRIFL